MYRPSSISYLSTDLLLSAVEQAFRIGKHILFILR
nr:MAG TPA: hypothetical protein [Caudoviricetes sp.]